MSNSNSNSTIASQIASNVQACGNVTANGVVSTSVVSTNAQNWPYYQNGTSILNPNHMYSYDTTYKECVPKTIEERELEDAYLRDKEFRAAEHREKIEALKTFFPRGHPVIDNLDIMVDIARENQLNPLYEQVLKEFDEAKLIMSRAASKLASAVKLTDQEIIDDKVKSSISSGMTINSFSGINYGSVAGLTGSSSYSPSVGSSTSGTSWFSNLMSKWNYK